MSDNHHMSEASEPSIGEVNHITKLSEDLCALYLQENYSDITLIIDNTRLPAHRVILASRSDYFRALLYNGMKESHSSEVELKVSSLSAFKYLLKYLYSGHIQLASYKEETILEIFALAHEYGFMELENAISIYLKETLAIRNVCVVYDAANLFNLHHLAEFCRDFIDRQALDIIHHESVYSLSANTLKEMISRDSFCAPEIDIFRAVCEWQQRNECTDTLKHIISSIRLSLISTNDLLSFVRRSGLVDADDILDAIQAKSQSRDSDLRYRGSLLPEENVACVLHNAIVINGENKHALLDGDSSNYDMEKGFTRHHIDDTNNQGILIKLGMQCIINHIRMLLWDKDMRSYGYYIEVSMDSKDWIRVIDHSKYSCRSWQYLYFNPRVARYIRVVGTHNTVNRVFHLVSFESMFTNKQFLIERGLLVPSFNVASTVCSACVIEGVSRTRNALINGDSKHYDWDNGYTCHQLGSGAIVVQLAQPFMIDSMRLLLWDTDSRSYSYYIEVSTDQQHWHIVADKRNEFCRSWQLIRFARRPIVFIRIIGTYNSANEVFHCVHFECPAQLTTEDSDSAKQSENKLDAQTLDQFTNLTLEHTDDEEKADSVAPKEKDQL